ncbi:MAG: hypothetical protein O3A84_12480, partial [Proteobacteria bacterium]|nr:hypothetical protein [Pseudomonadota bacterium]
MTRIANVFRHTGQNAVIGLFAGAFMIAGTGMAFANPEFWKIEWPKTDFSKTSVEFPEIFSGGPPK